MSAIFDLHTQDKRSTTFPIHRPELWSYYKKSESMYWTPEEITLSSDIVDYQSLSNAERTFVKNILAFFAVSDGIVVDNIAARFRKEIPILEAEYFYDHQVMMENIHAQTYSLLVDTLIIDPLEREVMFNAVQTIPVIGKMAKWMFNCIDSAEPLPARILRMVCVEGLFFIGCFCAIYWLSNRGLMPGLGHSNELISRDETLHTIFAIAVYDMVLPEHKLQVKDVHKIFHDGVLIAKDFINTSLCIDLPEMNSRLMNTYIECQADNLLTLLDVPVLYGSKNPFAFMEQINLPNKVNFFERRGADYSKPIQTIDNNDSISYDF
jgi:ribonucleoside-diphosphate reductase beta chain